jgi:hypothetical protein
MKKNRENVLKTALRRAIPKPEAAAEAPAPESRKSVASARAPKLSVSLYQRDLHRLDEIKEFMQKRGIRNVSDSEALRLAIRGIELGEGLLDVYQEMLGEDGRRKAS